MGQFFPNAHQYVSKHGFANYVNTFGSLLDEVCWSDLHKDVFGFRPRGSHHYPDPFNMWEAEQALHKMLNQQIVMERKVKLANQYKLETRIAKVRQRYDLSYRQALVIVFQETADGDCYHGEGNGPNGGEADEGQFCHELGLDYGLEPMFRHIIRGELT